MEPYYPVNDEKNQALYQKYAKLAEKEENVIFGGRLGEYKYYDMDKVIASAWCGQKKSLGHKIYNKVYAGSKGDGCCEMENNHFAAAF